MPPPAQAGAFHSKMPTTPVKKVARQQTREHRAPENDRARVAVIFHPEPAVSRQMVT